MRISQLNKNIVTLNFIIEIRNNNSRNFEILILTPLLISLLIVIINYNYTRYLDIIIKYIYVRKLSKSSNFEIGFKIILINIPLKSSRRYQDSKL